MTSTSKRLAIAAFLIATPLFGQVKPMPSAPVESPLAPVSKETFTVPRWTAVIGLGHGKVRGYSPVGSVDFRINETYGLYFARSTTAYSGGLSLRFGHKTINAQK